MTNKKVRPKRVVRPRLRHDPIILNKQTTWFYEERGGIRLIHWCKDANGNRQHALSVKIPWRSLLESARRCRPEEVKIGEPREKRVEVPVLNDFVVKRLESVIANGIRLVERLAKERVASDGRYEKLMKALADATGQCQSAIYSADQR